MDALVGVVAGIEEIDDNNVVLLPVTVTTADALLDALGIPRQVEIDHQRTELHVDALCGRFGGDEDRAGVAKVLDKGSADVDGTRAGDAVGVGIFLQPLVVNGLGCSVVIGPVEEDDFAPVAVFFQVERKGALGAAGFCEDEGALVGAGLRHRFEAEAERGEQFFRLCFDRNAQALFDEFIQFRDFFGERGDTDLGKFGVLDG